MAKKTIPSKWDLSSLPRYKRQNMERAMRGRIERGLVELITNSDDSYRDLEDRGRQVSGKIRIEIERRRSKPSIVKVRDRATGMNRAEMYKKLGTLGRRTSGFEVGKQRRGLHGRGARDVAAFGPVHFESIKDGKYNHLVIPPSLNCYFEKSSGERRATREIRKNLGIPRNNGTVVTIEVDNRFRIPQHETLVKDFSRYYSLRDIFSNPAREIVIVDVNQNREDPLVYRFPQGKVLFNDDLEIPKYPDAIAHFVIREHKSCFEQETLPYREGGILVKSTAAIHDCTYFNLEQEPFAWRFSGELHCAYIDKLIREYEDREEANPDNPNHPTNNQIRLLDPFRDGLMLEHPFAKALYNKCRKILKPFIEELKEAEQESRRDVTDEELNKKLDSLSKEISKIFEEKTKELEEDIQSGSIESGTIEKLPIGLIIIPPEEHPIVVNKPKTFSVIVKNYETLNTSQPVYISSSNPEDVRVRNKSVFFKKILKEGKVGRTSFTVEGSTIGTEAFIEARYNGFDNSVHAKVIEPPSPPEVPEGLSFEKPLYHLRINKVKKLVLRLKGSELNSPIQAKISSNHPGIVVKGGGKCELCATERPMILQGKVKVQGRQLKAKGTITAIVEGFESAETDIVVEERTPTSGIELQFKPVEDDFGVLRYSWDVEKPYLLKIGAKHPSIRKYLGEPIDNKYPGINSPLYHTVLAEVIAEALAFRILEKLFKREGQGGMLDFPQTDTYYHRHFSDFLSIAHKNLVTESTIT